MSRVDRSIRVALLHVDVHHPMGAQRYEWEITRALRALPSSDFWVSPVSVSSLRSRLASDVKLPLRVLTEMPLSVQKTLMKACLRRFGLVHRMDLRLPAAPVEVVTVHDVAPLRFPDEGPLPRQAAASLRRARAVIAPSAFAADDIAEALRIDRPTVVHYGVPPDAFNPEPLSTAQRQTMGIKTRYLLHCGGVTLRKNLRGLHRAWTVLRERIPDVQLVLAGPADPRRSGLFTGDERVAMPGRVDRRTLLGLMASAEALVVPSLYEGYGFPAVEAMACGTPVVAAGVAALPEICGDAALLCDIDHEAMAVAMGRVLEDGRLRDELIIMGRARAGTLTWDVTAQRHLSVYRNALENA